MEGDHVLLLQSSLGLHHYELIVVHAEAEAEAERERDTIAPTLLICWVLSSNLGCAHDKAES